MLSRWKILLVASFVFPLVWCMGQQGFPQDFPQIVDNGGYGKGTILGGFGGEQAFDQEANRAAVKRNPVILLHGNGGNAQHSQWGMLVLRQYLKEWGYNDSEIWAVSYLGANNSSAELPNPHTGNIDDVRRFIDAVREYLDVQKVDIIGHSLGGNLAKCYLLGLQQNGSWQKSDRRFDAIGTLVTMSAAHYGLGLFSIGEFQSGSNFEQSLHKLDGIEDDTPYGASSTSAQIGSYKKVTSLDDHSITYVAVWANGDFVDQQNFHTGRLQGAHLNRAYDLGSGLPGHERIIKDKGVFSDILGYLNSHPNTPPEPKPPVVSIAPKGGEFIGSIQVQIRATNKPDTIFYSLADGNWREYTSPFTLKKSAVVEAKAENIYGTSTVVSAEFTKKPIPPYEEALGTATEHYLVGRLDNQRYIAMGAKYGYIERFFLYLLDGSDTWTDIKPE